jgi:hypothetical protein
MAFTRQLIGKVSMFCLYMQENLFLDLRSISNIKVFVLLDNLYMHIIGVCFLIGLNFISKVFVLLDNLYSYYIQILIKNWMGYSLKRFSKKLENYY